jgi:glutaminyl-peptide cyclotransferase
MARMTRMSSVTRLGWGLLMMVTGCTQPNAPSEAAPPGPSAPFYGFLAVNSFPHDPEAFTQGLIYRDGFLYESTGLNGRSSVRKVALDTGKVVQRRDVEQPYFAEGLTEWAGHLVQLTWQTNVGFVYDAATFEPQRTFMYTGEGWGLTHDDNRLIMSDGTARLRFLDPMTFAETGGIDVSDGGRPVDKLNELEFVNGEIYANVWMTERIAIIAPDSGHVTAWLDLTGLRPTAGRQGDDVLNGIAYDASGDRLFITGKLWPQLFQIRVRK